MDIDYLIKSENIPLGNIGKTREEYDQRFKSCDVSEQHIQRLMLTLQDSCEEIIFLGGQTVRNFSMGYRKLRKASYDIDTIGISEETIIKIHKFATETSNTFLYNPEHRYFYLVLMGNPVSISPENIYGIPIEQSDIREYQGLTMIKPEILSTLKLRRRLRGEVRAKDIIDISSLLLAAITGKFEFDFKYHQQRAGGLGNQFSIGTPYIIQKLLACGMHKPNEKEVLKEYLESITT